MSQISNPVARQRQTNAPHAVLAVPTTSDTSSTINITMIVTSMPSMTCLNVLLASLGYESATKPQVLYVLDELASLRSLIGVIEISI